MVGRFSLREVVIIDDHFLVREAVRRLLPAVADIGVREAASTRHQSLFREDRPGRVLVHLNSPNSRSQSDGPAFFESRSSGNHVDCDEACHCHLRNAKNAHPVLITWSCGQA